MTLPLVSDLSVVSLPMFTNAHGRLGVAELPSLVNFLVARMFWISDVPADARRGGHAHKRCHQYMICLAGRIDIDSYDGQGERAFVLEAGQAVHVPPGIYASERFETPSSILAVLCDLPYDRDDYIHSRADLDAWRAGAAG
jgi:mannose-6-phosphate isomerase-like protein (cupin superfamily)